MISATNPFSLQGKTILITGASSGIGKRTAIECSKLGAKLIITGRDAVRLHETMMQLVGDGHASIVMDVNNMDKVSELLMDIEALDGVVYAAGIQKTIPAKFIQQQDCLDIFDTNFFSIARINAFLLTNKKLNKGASIVLVASTAAGIVAENGNALYSATKGALTAYAKVLALELVSRKIRVNCVLPAMVKTALLDTIMADKEELEADEKRYPLGYGEPKDVAFASIYLLSYASKWITGTNLLLDGGLTLK